MLEFEDKNIETAYTNMFKELKMWSKFTDSWRISEGKYILSRRRTK